MRDIPAFMGTFYSAIDITVRDLFSTLMIISIIIWASVMLAIMVEMSFMNNRVGLPPRIHFWVSSCAPYAVHS